MADTGSFARNLSRGAMHRIPLKTLADSAPTPRHVPASGTLPTRCPLPRGTLHISSHRASRVSGHPRASPLMLHLALQGATWSGDADVRLRRAGTGFRP